MKKNKLFKCVGIGVITIIIVITVSFIVKREDYYIRKVNPSTDDSTFINATGIDDLLCIEFRIKSPNGLPVKQELFFQRYINGKLKEEESFNVNGVVYPNMKLKVDEGKAFFTKIGFKKELGFELYHFFSKKEWARGTTKVKNIQIPLKSESLAGLAVMEWEFDEYRIIGLDNEYILRIKCYEENGIIPLEQEIFDDASEGNKESLEIIIKRYPIVEVLKIKISSMVNQ